MLYVSDEELAEFLGLDSVGGLPAWTRSMIRRASSLVEDATAGARYETTAGGFPADPRKREALRDATAQMVEDWISAGIDPSKGVAQLPRRAASKSALGVSVTYEQDGSRRAQEALAGGEDLSGAALRILWNAGLISATVGAAGAAAPTYVPAVDEVRAALKAHELDDTPHEAYDDAPNLALTYENGLI